MVSQTVDSRTLDHFVTASGRHTALSVLDGTPSDVARSADTELIVARYATGLTTRDVV